MFEDVELLVELLDWEKAGCRSEMGSFILQVGKFSFQLRSPYWWLLGLLYEYPGVEVKLFVSLQITTND